MQNIDSKMNIIQVYLPKSLMKITTKTRFKYRFTLLFAFNLAISMLCFSQTKTETTTINFPTGLLSSPNILNNKEMALNINYHSSNIFNGNIQEKLTPTDVGLNIQYGVKNLAQIGASYNYYNNMAGVNLKIKLAEQGNNHNIPISASFSTNAMATLVNDTARYNEFPNRLSYVSQLTLGGMYFKRLFVAVSPTIIHRNLVDRDIYGLTDNHTFFALGGFTSIKVYKNWFLNAEYIHNFSNYRNNHPDLNFSSPLNFTIGYSTNRDFVSIGLTNTPSALANSFLPLTTLNWTKNQLNLWIAYTRKLSL